MALVTYENVVAAAEALVADGQKPSVRSVIKQLGGGSPNAVLKLLNEYKAGRPVIRSSDIELDPSIITAMIRQMRTVAETATADAEERLSSLNDDLATMAESNQSLEQRVEQLNTELASSATTIEQLTSAQHDSDLRHQSEMATLKSKISEVSADLDKERDRANGAQQELGKAQAKAEAVPALEAQIAKLQDELKAESAARAAAEQRAAVAEAQGKLVAEQAAKASGDADKQIEQLKAAADKADQAHANALAQLRKDLDDSRQSARQQVEQTQAAADKTGGEHKGQAEQLRRDLEDAKTQVREATQEIKAARKQIDTLHEQLAAAGKAATMSVVK